MIRVLRFTIKQTWEAALMSMLLLALGLLGTRFLLSQIEVFKHDLERLIEEQTGLVVAIGRLSADMLWLDPRLTLEAATLTQADGVAPDFELGSIEIGLSLWQSLRNLAPRLRYLNIRDSELRLRTDDQGHLDWGGFGGGLDAERGSAGLLAPGFWLMLENSRIHYRSARAGEVVLEGVTLALRTQDDELVIGVEIKPDQVPTGQLQSRIWLRNPQAPMDRWSGRFFLKADGAMLARLSGVLPLGDGGRFQVGDGDIQLWGRFRDGLPVATQGQFRIANLTLQPPTVSPLPVAGLHFERLAGRLSFAVVQQGWRLGLVDLELEDDAPFDLVLRKGERQLELAIDRLDIGPLLQRLGPLLPPEWIARLDQGRLAGTLESVLAQLSDQDWSGLQLRAKFRDLAWMPGDDAASASAFAGLSGQLRVDGASGLLKLDSRDAKLAIRPLFRDGWPLQRLAGEIGWRLTEQGLRLSSAGFEADNGDVKTRSRFDLFMPSDRMQSPWLDMATRFHDADAGAVPNYLPVAIMPGQLVAWLDRALVSGRVPQGMMSLRGPLDAFPFERQEGRFEVRFAVDDVNLDYREEWPRLEGIQADVQFLNNSFALQSDYAALLESGISELRVAIDELSLTSPLVLSGRVDGPFDDLFRVLRESPLRHEYSRYIRDLRASGSSRLLLDLAIPLEDDGASGVTVAGTLSWTDQAELEWLPLQLGLEQLQGALRFDERGVSGEDIGARAFGVPLRLALKGEGAATRVSGRFVAREQTLDRLLPLSRLLRLQGEFPVLLELDLHHARSGKDALELSVSSDLLGLRIGLPQPFAKEPEETRTLHLTASPQEDGAWQLDGSLQDEIALRARWYPGRNDRLPSVLMQLGGGDLKTEGLPGIHVQGAFQHLDLDAWMRQVLDTDFPDRVGNADGLPMSLSLTADRARLMARPFHEFSLLARPGPGSWELSLASRECIGKLSYEMAADANDRMQLRSSHCYLPALDKVAGPTSPGVKIDPAKLPDMDIDISDFRFGRAPLGAIIVQTRHMPHGLQLERILSESRHLKLVGRGSWKNIGATQRTHLLLSASGPSFGALTDALDDSLHMTDGPFSLLGQFSWPGPVDAPLWQHAIGSFKLDIGEGQFAALKPGAARLLGGINLGQLSRRLSLDFSDLFAKGYLFEEIVGSFTLADGNLWIKNLLIDGPSARGEFAGRVGLKQQDLYVDLDLTPKISSSLPLAGYLTGGLAVGTALLLIQQLAGNEVDRIASSRYRVTGPWLEPEIERLVNRASDGVRAGDAASAPLPSGFLD